MHKGVISIPCLCNQVLLCYMSPQLFILIVLCAVFVFFVLINYSSINREGKHDEIRRH